MSFKHLLNHQAMSKNLHQDCVRLVNRSSRLDVTHAVSKFISTNDSTCEHIFINKEEEESLSSTTDHDDSYVDMIRYFFWNIVTCGCFARI